jgi:hypothetical protein
VGNAIGIAFIGSVNFGLVSIGSGDSTVIRIHHYSITLINST